MILLTCVCRLSSADISDSHFLQGEHAEAATRRERFYLSATDPEYPHQALVLGLCYYQSEEQVDQWSDSGLIPLMIYRAAVSAYRAGDYLGAIGHLRKLCSGDDGSLTTEVLYLNALCHFALSEYDSTLSELGRLEERETPLRIGAQKLKADALFHKEDYWRALDLYREIALDSLRVDVSADVLDHSRYQYQRSLFKLGLYSSPVTALTVYVRKYPGSSRAPKYQMEIAQYYLEMREYYAAKKEFERYLRLFQGHPGEAEATMGLASAYGALSRYPDARREYLKVDQNSPLAPRAWLAAADISLSLGELGRAISEYQAVHETFPESPFARRALCMQGQSFIDLKEVDEAMSVYERLQSSPDEGSSCEIFVYRLALFLIEQGLADDALDLLDTRWSTDSLKAQALLRRGTVLFEIGRFQEAATDLLRASDHLPEGERTKPLYRAGQALEAAGMKEEARLRYLSALEYATDSEFQREISERIDELESAPENEESEK
jgi:tetratricopeptide (TPR) repeat protein